MTTLALLHPGDMGASVGAAARTAGVRVVWASDRRSEATRARAEDAGLEAVGSLAAALGDADVVISVCPPHGAEELAGDVVAAGFKGLFCDANAISPERAKRIGELVEGAGCRFVDGGIIGPPAREPGKTRLYLSGGEAASVAALFAGSLLDARVISDAHGDASALKMCYAAWTKGRTALLLAVRALARADGVEDSLLAEWALSQPDLARTSEATGSRVAHKAWRWVGEMEEIAATFAAADLPSGFHQAAAELYADMKGFKDPGAPPSFDAVMEALLARSGTDVETTRKMRRP